MERFSGIVLKATSVFTQPLLDKPSKEFGEAILNKILDHEGPKSIQRNPSREEFFVVNKLLIPLIEIRDSFKAIENIPIYARSFPYKRQGIAQSDYLRYHIENYLNEFYLLKNRLLAYQITIERSYKRSANFDHVSKNIPTMKKVIRETFILHSETRHNHVHKLRYTDEGLERLSTLELLSRDKGEFGIQIRSISSTAYKETRSKWVAKMKDEIKAFRIVLEVYFSALNSAITRNGELIIPDNLRGAGTKSKKA